MPSLMESIVTLDVGAQEPWPNDVKLYQPYSMEQILLPDNANCLSVQAFLHMCGLPFQIEHRANAEFMSPSGKVPFIKCGAFVVSELEPIVQFVANKGITLTEELSADQKSDLRAYMSIIYTVLMNAELYICWCDKRTYNEVTKVRNGSVYPWPLNHFQTWSKRSAVTRKLKVLGWYQKTLESVYQEVENCCQALSERLDGKEYFFGSKPTELDAYIYGNIFAILSSPEYSNELVTIVMKFPNLVSHCKRICTNYVYNTSINFSELLVPTKSASQLIMNNNTCTYELKSKNEVTAITRYLKFMNSDSDLSELTHSSVSQESSKSDGENIKRTSSLTDCTVFDTQQYSEEISREIESKTNEKYQPLSRSDHDYLVNLLSSDKPPETEIKFMQMKSKVSDTSVTSEASVKQSGSKIPLKSTNKSERNLDITVSRGESEIELKVSKKSLTILNDCKKNSTISLTNEKFEKQESKDSEKSLIVLNEAKKMSYTSVSSEEFSKRASKKSLSIANEDKISTDTSFTSTELEKKGSVKSITIADEGDKVSDTSLLGKLGKRVSRKSLSTINEDEKYFNMFISSEGAGKKISNKSFSSINEDKYLDLSLNSDDSGNQDKKVPRKSLSSLIENKILDIFTSGEGAGKQDKKVSKNSLGSIDEKYLDISISSLDSDNQDKKVSKKSLSSLMEDKYRDICNDDSGKQSKKGSKHSLAGIDEKYLDISTPSENSGKLGKKVSKKSLSSLMEHKYLDICNEESRQQNKKVSKDSLASIDAKYLNISTPSETSGKLGKKDSKKSLSSLMEDKCLDICNEESGKESKKISKFSLASIDDKYLDISSSSENSGKLSKKVSKKSLSSLMEDKYLVICNEESGKQSKKNSKHSLASIDDKYLDISITSCDSGKQGTKVKKSVSSGLIEDKYLDFSTSSIESGQNGKNFPEKSMSSLNEDDYLSISISSEESGQGKNVSKKSMSTLSEDKYLNFSTCSEESGQSKNVLKKSLSGLVEGKCLDNCVSNEEFEKQEENDSQKSLIIDSVARKFSNTSLSSEDSFKQKKISKKSSSENEDDMLSCKHVYSNISISSDEFEIPD